MRLAAKRQNLNVELQQVHSPYTCICSGMCKFLCTGLETCLHMCYVVPAHACALICAHVDACMSIHMPTHISAHLSIHVAHGRSGPQAGTGCPCCAASLRRTSNPSLHRTAGPLGYCPRAMRRAQRGTTQASSDGIPQECHVRTQSTWRHR